MVHSLDWVAYDPNETKDMDGTSKTACCLIGGYHLWCYLDHELQQKHITERMLMTTGLVSEMFFSLD